VGEERNPVQISRLWATLISMILDHSAWMFSTTIGYIKQHTHHL